MTRAPITFYYEFSSPYAYFASERIEDLAARHGRSIVWKPFLLGAIFKQTGAGPLTDIPLKADYAKRDFARLGRLLDVPFTWPPQFPFSSVAASRIVYWAGEARAPDLTHALFRAAFARGEALGSVETVLAVAEAAGLDRTAAEAAIRDPAIKARLADETDAAIQAGVCGSPFFIVEGEPFWGCDRMDMLERWLETGGW